MGMSLGMYLCEIVRFLNIFRRKINFISTSEIYMVNDFLGLVSHGVKSNLVFRIMIRNRTSFKFHLVHSRFIPVVSNKFDSWCGVNPGLEMLWFESKCNETARRRIGIEKCECVSPCVCLCSSCGSNPVWFALLCNSKQRQPV